MDKSLRGKKHVCSNCNTKFFDFNKDKIICPACNTEVTLIKVSSLNIDKLNIKDKNNEVDSEIALEEDIEFDNDIEEIIDDDNDDNIDKENL